MGTRSKEYETQEAREKQLDCSSALTERDSMFPLPQQESLLAFSLDPDGRPRIIAEFASHRDRFALYAIARAALDRLSSEISNELVQPLLSGQRCS